DSGALRVMFVCLFVCLLIPNHLHTFSAALDFTQKWLQESADSALRGAEGGATSSPGTSSQLLLNVHNHAYLRLLHWEQTMDTFPEVGLEPLTYL
ncbi:T-complex protein 11-like protein 1, partial [Tachysurus ichikawai]